ncbi:hypothetical protein M9458_051897 [Cirrhinus mrigala]|uniref:Uncharacterized protein n=1 Tax=Cirrhinus mrigala TaxID=683832 RepID=A0ABD0MQ43_CIRMR
MKDRTNNRSPVTDTTHSRTYAQIVDSDTSCVVKPKKGLQHIHVQIQTSPRRNNDVEQITTTPPNRGEWSFDQEYPPLEPPPGLEPTPPIEQTSRDETYSD